MSKKRWIAALVFIPWTLVIAGTVFCVHKLEHK